MRPRKWESALYPALTLSGCIGLESLTFAGLGRGEAIVSQVAARLDPIEALRHE